MHTQLMQAQIIAGQIAPLLQQSEERAAFEITSGDGVWPEVGSWMMTRLAAGQELASSWVEIQPGIYRYVVFQEGDLSCGSCCTTSLEHCHPSHPEDRRRK